MKRAPGLVLLCLALAQAGCPGEQKQPGDENMGNYVFHAEPVDLDCKLANIPSAGFDFTGTFSRFRDGGGVFLNLNGVARDARFDGQVVVSTHSASRTFVRPDGGSCGSCDTRLVETVTVALLSKSQSDALDGGCPPNPLDGGLPGADAGVTLPGSTATGFDAVRVCGELLDQVSAVPPADCDVLCTQCRLWYRLTGDRR